MDNYSILCIREEPDLLNCAADWFHEKWGIPREEYYKSMNQCLLNNQSIPQWYVAILNGNIIGGLGVIENDFHDRKDLSPNICALYVEKTYRNQGVAGRLLDYACSDMKKYGIEVLYLMTDHSSFYEKNGWKFLCMVQGDGDNHLSRMYVHRAP
ncbi:GNAT family N-acetyltransferase [Solibaculum mannosilyticum]|uniref:GNAT family N-acetyltransferase n=1 Tax=Solibaculum mannosilyticum TaxID=2780922 RepID=UPI0034C278C9